MSESGAKLSIKDQLAISLKKIIDELGSSQIEPEVAIPSDLSKGDLTTNIAMRFGGNPMEIGEKIVERIREDRELYSLFDKIELLKPGFINFYYSRGYISGQINDLLSTKSKADKPGQTIIFEFGDPNPFKEAHIGHLRNLVLGEAISRLIEGSKGIKVIRANYQGDVGLHVAKAIWGMTKLGFDTVKDTDKAAFLGKAYAHGAKAYDDDEKAKVEIGEINKKVYAMDPEIEKLWKEGREISLDHFEKLYKLVGIKYDKYYFESHTAPEGLSIVKKNIGKVFEIHDGATIFRGEKEGLHTRVFITSEGNPTYEAKDLGLAFLKDEDFPKTDKSIIMTANEQAEYFKVLLAALRLINPGIAGKTSHLSFGFVDLKEGKMSSRSGNVVPAFWLIEETKKRLKKGFPNAPEGNLEALTIGAVKWSMLKFSRESNISFNIDESIQIEGNSGPYMQYTYARTISLLEKAGKATSEAKVRENLDGLLLALMRQVCQFEGVKASSAQNYSPNVLTNYLFSLAQNFNNFYEKEKVIGAVDEDQKIAVVAAVSHVLKQGLTLLAIDTPEKI